ncbi:hypothetical protein DPMN_165331 [Dreissena polymorpha]|uniref:Uncharacterized protein n=2 Tax=Dreissena polymorpha TaxID=45954 RepID=A0A9D4EZG5_DREPO|nr:hypothetical protein DPMN_165331 [Dreissena polymorpha]
MALICIVLNIINIDWGITDTVNGIIIVIVLGVLQGSVLEFPVQTIATLLIGGERRHNKRAPCDRLTVILNYNLLATGKDDILECIETMYMAYVGNLSPNVSAVLVSATNDEELKEYELQIRDTYRAILYDDLYREGLAFARGEYELVDPIHLHNVWAMYVDVDRNVFVTDYLEDICDRYAREFMVVHRVSRVLRKCGQYQDLMLLSEGEFEAYSYCDKCCYGRSARETGEALFHTSEDVSNIIERKFDYTLVLDADTGVPRGGVFDMLRIAAAHPERGIIQPSIKLHCGPGDTMFMHLEAMRQSIYEPMTNAITAMFEQSSYFGKALIKNKLYIDYVIGSKDDLIERVPVDVLSHDTFEAALLKPLYAGSTFLLEAPSHNYVTWNIRERRWNRGEILLAMYFWKYAFGKPMRWLQQKLQRSKFNKTKVRTESKLDFVTSYIAHSALRQMMMKPALLLYIVLHISVHLRYRYASIIIVMFSVLVFPKFATCNRENYKFVFLETIASILQFTPEALVGCVRIWRALYANISINAKWVPQRAVEEEFKSSNPFISSLKHLWGYSLFSMVLGVLVVIFLERAILVLVMLITTALLPFYTGFTSLPINFKCCKPRSISIRRLFRRGGKLDISAHINTVADPNMYSSIGNTSEPTLELSKIENNLLTPNMFTNYGFDERSELPNNTKTQNNASWSRDVESMIANSERYGQMLSLSAGRNSHSRRVDGREKHVSVINVKFPKLDDTNESNEYDVIHLSSSDGASSLSPTGTKSFSSRSSLSSKLPSLDITLAEQGSIWYENNVTYIKVGKRHKMKLWDTSSKT